jgi:hypothetical protein
MNMEMQACMRAGNHSYGMGNNHMLETFRGKLMEISEHTLKSL